MRTVHRIPPLALFALLAALGSLSAEDRIIQKDGTEITGEVVGFRDGRIVVRVGDDFVEISPESVHTFAEVGRKGPSTAAPDPTHLTIEEVEGALALRPAPPVAPEIVQLYQDSVSAYLRGEWDFASKGLEELLDRAPSWADPQILAGILHADRGHGQGVGVALRLQKLFPDDELAQRVAAEIFRRSSFPHRYAHAMERVLSRQHDGSRLEYEGVRLWWPIDVERAREHWGKYRQHDPQLRQAWCEEGNALRRVRLALDVRDWMSAQTAFDELQRKFPWMQNELEALQVEILQGRLNAAEGEGHLDAALVACETLEELDPERAELWRTRRQQIQSSVLEQAFVIGEPKALGHWCNRHEHLLRGSAEPWRERLSVRFQELGADALVAGDYEQSRLGFAAARTWHPTAAPQPLEPWLDRCLERFRSDLAQRRTGRVLQGLEILNSTYPAAQVRLLEPMRRQYQEVLAPILGQEEYRQALVALDEIFVPARSGRDGISVAAGEALTPGAERESAAGLDPAARARAQQVLARYYPYEPGTRWIYRTGDGKREERRVESLTPLEEGGWKIGFSVHGDELPHPLGFDVFLVGDQLIRGFRSVPPGEYALRYPLAGGASWSWRKHLFEYERKIVRPATPIRVAGGLHDDYLVVEVENRIDPGSGGTPYRSRQRITYVAGIGLARIESEIPSLARELIEFSPPPPGSSRDAGTTRPGN